MSMSFFKCSELALGLGHSGSAVSCLGFKQLAKLGHLRLKQLVHF